jgi:hypothetical protein
MRGGAEKSLVAAAPSVGNAVSDFKPLDSHALINRSPTARSGTLDPPGEARRAGEPYLFVTAETTR